MMAGKVILLGMGRVLSLVMMTIFLASLDNSASVWEAMGFSRALFTMASSAAAGTILFPRMS